MNVPRLLLRAAGVGRLVPLVLLVFLSLLSAVRAEPNQLVIGMTQFPYTLHPSIEAMMAKTYVLGMARRPLTAFDAQWKPVCMLCEELPTLENGGAVRETTPDGKEGVAVTYTIRPEAKWGDGTPVSTRDVEFTAKVGKHPQSAVIPKEFYRRLYKIDAHDERTFTLHFDKLDFDYNVINGFQLLPAHLEEAAFAEPAEYRNRTLYDTDPTNPGLYNGPYVISQFKAGQFIALTPNPYWGGDAPAFERIVVRTIENTAALEANLLSGAIDMIPGELGLSIDQAIAFEKRRGDRFNVIYKPGLVYEHIDLDLDNPILADVRVRRALVHAIDREAINQQLFGGRQLVASSGVNPLDWVHTEDVAHYPYDPERAQALLDEAGWTARGGGPRVNAAGEPLRLEIMTTAGNRSRELVEQVLRDQWKQVGVDVTIRNQPARVFFGETVSRRKFDAMAMFAWISGPESVPRTTLHSAHIPTQDNNWSGQNTTGFRNAEMDGLIEQIEVELDRDKRRALWARLQALYAEELPVIPLFFGSQVYILPQWLTGLVPTGHQDPSTLWVEHWRRR